MALEVVHLLPELSETLYEWYHLSHSDPGWNFDNVDITIVNHTDLKLHRTNVGGSQCEWGYTYNGRTAYNTQPAEWINPRSKTSGIASRNALGAGTCIASVDY